ncbi:MAG TPA: hypothetical protein P5567_02240 [Kiritimatiellia bacterium]|nr:hypothetical protein [Kiritimatiellia bacterium]HSA19104.1 hypothetical protein [Kiritimatiellia bacterium]
MCAAAGAALLLAGGASGQAVSERELVRRLVKDAYDRQAAAPSDERGYVARPEDNLVPGVRLEQFRADLEKGAGHELAGKFCAVHSSSALAVNTFAPFKDRPADLVLLGRSGFDPPVFEKPLPTGLHGTPPTLDVFLRRGNEVITVESKFLEYFAPKEAKFSASYNRVNLPWAEDCWWRVLEEAKAAGPRNLDVAQLVKHYFGISRLLARGDEKGWKPARATLLYLYWEPANAADLAVCLQHRKEIEELAARAANSKVIFRAMSYPDLWREWSALPALSKHTESLQRRYRVVVP